MIKPFLRASFVLALSILLCGIVMEDAHAQVKRPMQPAEMPQPPQPPSPPGTPPVQTPIDGGLGFLLAAGGAYAIKRIRNKNNNESDSSL